MTPREVAVALVLGVAVAALVAAIARDVASGLLIGAGFAGGLCLGLSR